MADRSSTSMRKILPGLGAGLLIFASSILRGIARPEQRNDAATKGYVDDAIQVATITLTAAQIKALNTTPVTVLAAALAGTGKSIIVERALFRLKFGTAAFAGGGAVQLQYAGQSTNLLSATVPAGFVNGASATTTDNAVNGAAGVVSIPQNTSVQVTCATGNFTTGDGTVQLVVWYRVA